MKGPDDDVPELNANDKKVLKKMISYEKLPDSTIAKEIDISPQAVFQIREKLQSRGIIKGYVPVIDYQKIGIGVMAVLIIKVKPKLWKEVSEEEIAAKMKETPYVIDAYRVSQEQASHVLVMGFRNSDQKQQYVEAIQTRLADAVQINSVYSFSVENQIKRNPSGLLHEIIDKQDFSISDLFIDPDTDER